MGVTYPAFLMAALLLAREAWDSEGMVWMLLESLVPGSLPLLSLSVSDS